MAKATCTTTNSSTAWTNNEREQGVIGVRPSIDAIAEVKVDTNNFAAEVGRDAGAVVNVITKSGTNRFHGSAYEFFRNDIFDARDFFAKQGEVVKPAYHHNQFGGSIGGPIRKDKTFSSPTPKTVVSFKGKAPANSPFPPFTRSRIQATSLTSAARIFRPSYSAPSVSATSSSSQHPTFQEPFFKTTKASPTGRNTLSPPMVASIITSTTAIRSMAATPTTTSTPSFPAPFQRSTKRASPSVPGGNVLAYDGPSLQKAHGFILDYIHSFTPNLLLDLKTGYTRLDFHTTTLNADQNVDTAFGIPNGNFPDLPGTSGLTPADFLVGGYAILGDSPYLPIDNVNNVFQYQAALTYTHGKHSLKFGGQLIRRQLNYFQSSYPLGVFLYAGVTGNPVADMLAGYNVGYERANTLIEQGFRMSEPNAYAEDDWRVTPNLTINLGVRYDLFTPITEAHGHYAQLRLPDLDSHHRIAGSQRRDSLRKEKHCPAHRLLRVHRRAYGTPRRVRHQLLPHPVEPLHRARQSAILLPERVHRRRLHRLASPHPRRP